MRKRTNDAAAVCFILVVSMVAVTMPKPAYANNGDDEKPIRLRATAESSPIGKVISLGDVSINGLPFVGEQALWGGETVQVLSANGASVSLDSLGQVQLKKGAMVRLARNAATTEGTRGVLVASLISGDMSVKLNREAKAYIQSCGAVFTATVGSTFRVSTREGRAVAYATVGSVEAQDPATQKRYFVRPVGLGSNISVRARSTRQIQVQVTDENDRPVPDIPIIIALGSTGAGTLGAGATAAAVTSITVQTNAQGIATAIYTAGETAATTEITATVEGTRYSWTGQISVAAAGAGFWNPLTTSLVVAGAAAGVGLGVYFANRNNDPISPNGPPDIRPK